MTDVDTRPSVAELLAAWRVLDAHERAQVIRAVIELLDADAGKERP